MTTKHRHKNPSTGKWLTDEVTLTDPDIAAIRGTDTTDTLATLRADLNAAVGRITKLENPPTTPPNPPAPTITDLQGELNDAVAGQIIDLGGATFAGPFSVPKPVHLTNGGLTGKPSEYILTCTADAFFSQLKFQGGYVSAKVDGAHAPQFIGNQFLNLVYMAVMTLGSVGVLVQNNLIDGVVPITAHDQLNAYGVSFTHDSSGVKSSGCKALGNTIKHIPTWHGLDTHGGIDCEFSDNIISGVRRAIALTDGAVRPIVRRNQITAPTAAEKVLLQSLIDSAKAATPPIDAVAMTNDIHGIWFPSGTDATFDSNVGTNFGSAWYYPGGTIKSSTSNTPSIP